MNPFEFFIGRWFFRSIFVFSVLPMVAILIYGWASYLRLLPREKNNPLFIVFWFIVLWFATLVCVASVPVAYQNLWILLPNP